MNRADFDRIHGARTKIWDFALAHPESVIRAGRTMKLAAPARKPFWRRVLDFVKAVTGPRVRHAEYLRRIAVCSTCPKLVTKGRKRYCGACGCPKWLPAELRIKARLANADCPLGKWPTKNEERDYG